MRKQITREWKKINRQLNSNASYLFLGIIVMGVIRIVVGLVFKVMYWTVSKAFKFILKVIESLYV